MELEFIPEEEKKIVISPNPSHPQARKSQKKDPSSGAGEPEWVDQRQPIDITSDQVETYTRENRVIFKGSVIARQQGDIAIYADSIEAIMVNEGKGIKRVIASGNVKVQQGRRVASCQRAVFHNLEQKVLLTGDPKVWEGENMVSGEEIIFDIAQNRVEVKSGLNRRGKAKVYPDKGFEKLK
jgi:lipopolysaccharide export system protein LptA